MRAASVDDDAAAADALEVLVAVCLFWAVLLWVGGSRLCKIRRRTMRAVRPVAEKLGLLALLLPLFLVVVMRPEVTC